MGVLQQPGAPKDSEGRVWVPDWKRAARATCGMRAPLRCFSATAACCRLFTGFPEPLYCPPWPAKMTELFELVAPDDPAVLALFQGSVSLDDRLAESEVRSAAAAGPAAAAASHQSLAADAADASAPSSAGRRGGSQAAGGDGASGAAHCCRSR